MTLSVPSRFEPSAIVPTEQRVRLSWHLRTILADADLLSVMAKDPPPSTWVGFVRGELLDLVQQLEGGRPLGGG